MANSVPEKEPKKRRRGKGPIGSAKIGGERRFWEAHGRRRRRRRRRRRVVTAADRKGGGEKPPLTGHKKTALGLKAVCRRAYKMRDHEFPSKKNPLLSSSFEGGFLYIREFIVWIKDIEEGGDEKKGFSGFGFQPRYLLRHTHRCFACNPQKDINSLPLFQLVKYELFLFLFLRCPFFGEEDGKREPLRFALGNGGGGKGGIPLAPQAGGESVAPWPKGEGMYRANKTEETRKRKKKNFLSLFFAQGAVNEDGKGGGGKGLLSREIYHPGCTFCYFLSWENAVSSKDKKYQPAPCR